MYRLLSCFWHIDTSKPIVSNSKCYKILTFDEQDEVIDVYSSIHHGIAKYNSRVNYRTKEWRKFYESLVFIYDLEKELFDFQASKENA